MFTSQARSPIYVPFQALEIVTAALCNVITNVVYTQTEPNTDFV